MRGPNCKTARFQSEILWVFSNQSWDLLVPWDPERISVYDNMLGSSFGSCRPAFAPSQSSWEEPWRAVPTCWCWLWWHAPPTCCCPVRASLLPRCCVAARSTRLEPWHRPPLSRLRAVLCRWAWPRQVANPRGFLWSSLASWQAPRLLASWLSSSMAPTLVPAAVCESWIFCLIQLEELDNRNTQNGPQSREQKQLRSVAVCGKGELHISPDPRDLLLIFHPTLNINPGWLQLFVDAWLNHQISNVGPLLPKKRGYEKTIDISHGSLNVPIEHHPTIRYMVYNGYYKVMSNIPKMGQLPTPVSSRRKGSNFTQHVLSDSVTWAVHVTVSKSLAWSNFCKTLLC